MTNEVPDKSDSVETGQRLKLWRDAMGLKQRQIAEKLGISRSTYANYEVGVAEIPTDAMIVLKTLGFDPEADDPKVLRPTAPISQILLMIDVLASPEIPTDLKDKAKKELITALGLAS